MDVASGGGSKTRREWRGHCDNKVAVDGRKSQDRSRCNETAKLKTNFVDKLVRQRIELRRGVLCAVVGGCLREGGLAKVGCGNNRHGGSEKDKKLKLEGLKKRSKKPTRPKQRPTVNNSKTRFRKTKRSFRAMELN